MTSWPDRPAVPAADDLVRVPMFAALPPERRAAFAAAHPVRAVGAGTVLARNGEPARALFVVQRGRVAATVDHRDGRRTRFPTLPAPCAVDKAALLHRALHVATWTAAAPCRLRVVPAAAFERLLTDEPAVRDHVLGHLAAQVQRSRVAAGDVRTGPAARRVAAWLLAAGAASPGSRIDLPAGQQGLAEELGVSRVTTNRALRRLAREGIVSVGPRLVVVHDPPRLARRGA